LFWDIGFGGYSGDEDI